MHMLSGRRSLLPLFLLTFLFQVRSPAQSDTDRRAWAAIATLGEGFVVWETNRDGLWRIWRRELDGTNEHRLSPDERDRDHLCAAVSPDGQWIAYLSQPRGIDYNETKPDQQSPLRLMRADGSDDRQLVDNARRISGGNRAVVWVDAHRLHFLDGEHRARRVDLRTGKVSEPLHGDLGSIPNAAMTYVMDRHHVHPLDVATRTVRKTGRNLDGCEPTFTSDSRWSVRMAGAGGPIARIDPATSSIHPLLNKGDDRMPKDRGYLYFPMVSPCRRLLSFAASPNQHDHFKSDYEVYVAPIKPDTLELTGTPARYTFHGRTDRYPHVFLADVPLGSHSGEAPFRVTLSAPGGAVARWQSDDGATGGGATFTHTYNEPGRYTPKAIVDGREHRGQVNVLPSAPPAVVLVTVVDPRTLRVIFDEPVDIARMRAVLASRVGVRADGLSDDGRRLTLRLSADLADRDEVRLSGVRDLAQRPNEAPPASFTVERARWPVATDGLVFAVHSGSALAPVRVRGDHGLETTELVPRGLARRDGRGALEVARGAFDAPAAGTLISRALATSHAMTVEVVFQSADSRQSGPARIVSLSRDTGARNVTLGQQDDHLILRLRTTRTGDNGTNPEVRIGTINPTREQHVVVTYAAPNQLAVYQDGVETLRTTDLIAGDFSTWDDMPLTLGDEVTRDRDWRGRIDAVALYDRVLSADEVRQSFGTWAAAAAARPPVLRLRVETEVVALSPIPTAAQIAPYREGLVLAEHRVKRAEGAAGAPAAGSLVRVAHWALLDGVPVPDTSARRVGDVGWIELEPFGQQPQARALFLSDELELKLDLPVFLDVTPPKA